MSFPQPRPRLDALGAQLRAMQIAKHLPAPSGSVTVSEVRKDGRASHAIRNRSRKNPLRKREQQNA